MTSKQRAYLRGLANSIDPIFQIGKSGLSENLLKQLDDALEASINSAIEEFKSTYSYNK